MSATAATPLHRLSPTQIVFAEIWLIPEAWEDHLKALRALRVRGWKEPKVFEWSYDGIHYSIEPGKKAIVPYRAAEWAVKESAIFGFEKDIHGNDTVRLDHTLGQFPMIEITRRVTGDDPRLGGEGIEAAPEAAYPICPYCAGEVRVEPDKFLDHLEEVHKMSVVVKPEKTKAEQAMEEAINSK